MTTELPAELDLPSGAEDVLFRGAQEALRNVAKHSAARRVEVAVSVVDGIAALSVRDDGRGFLAAERQDGGDRHFGLRLLEDLVAEREGRLEVDSAPGAGTSFHLEVPLR